MRFRRLPWGRRKQNRLQEPVAPGLCRFMKRHRPCCRYGLDAGESRASKSRDSANGSPALSREANAPSSELTILLSPIEIEPTIAPCCVNFPGCIVDLKIDWSKGKRNTCKVLVSLRGRSAHAVYVSNGDSSKYWLPHCLPYHLYTLSLGERARVLQPVRSSLPDRPP